jgi:hypothetical protein
MDMIDRRSLAVRRQDGWGADVGPHSIKSMTAGSAGNS